MKILYVFTVGGTSIFFPALIRELIKQGNQVDIACGRPDRVKDCYRKWNCGVSELSCSRNPFSAGTRKAIREIRELVTEKHYDLVHCHTPVAAFCTRLACRKLRKKGLKVFYTAHGFHFFKGAPLKNWLIYYPLEKLCAKWTDVLITINREDYERAKAKFSADEVVYVPGVGVDVAKFRDTECDKTRLREEISVPKDAFMLLSVGGLNHNKNHRSVMKACETMNRQDVHYVIAGEGDQEQEIREYATSLKCADQIHILGRREDIPQLCKAADCFIIPSFREGLPVALMEAMASGLPSLGSDIRGVKDLIGSDRRFEPSDYNRIAELIDRMDSSAEWREQAVSEDKSVIDRFSKETVNRQMVELYGGQI